MQGRLVCRDSLHTCIRSLQFLTHFPRSSTTVKALLFTDSIDVGNILLVENGRWSIKTKKWERRRRRRVDKTSDLFIGSFDFSLRCVSKDSRKTDKCVQGWNSIGEWNIEISCCPIWCFRNCPFSAFLDIYKYNAVYGIKQLGLETLFSLRWGERVVDLSGPIRYINTHNFENLPL